MLSRVAHSIYWMNRYVERAESYARFLNVNFNLALDMPPNVKEQWEPLLIITDDIHSYKLKYKQVKKDWVINFMAFDQDNPNSIISSLNKARENARTVRENISLEMWEQINRLYLMIKESNLNSQQITQDPRFFFKEVILGIQLFHGITATTIRHSEAWHFRSLGLYLERADNTSRLLDVKYHILLPSANQVGSPLDLLQWTALLKSLSAYSVCRKKYGHITPKNVLELLILDRKFPRSIYFCIDKAKKSLREVSGYAPDNYYYNQAERLLGTMQSELEYTDIKHIINSGAHEYLNRIEVSTGNISNAIFETFFSLETNKTTNT